MNTLLRDNAGEGTPEEMDQSYHHKGWLSREAQFVNKKYENIYCQTKRSLEPIYRCETCN